MIVKAETISIAAEQNGIAPVTAICVNSLETIPVTLWQSNNRLFRAVKYEGEVYFSPLKMLETN